jgi:hypothetical protein
MPMKEISILKVFSTINLEFVLITENSSGFESLLKEMNNSQIHNEKSKIHKCENPNCKTAFPKFELCTSCNKNFCGTCLTNCEICCQKCCIFCIRIDYDKYRDTQICSNC